jgi:hypothetical protein
MQAIRASNLNPKMNAEPENAFWGGLYFKKNKIRQMVIVSNKKITIENIQRSNLGILCKKSITFYFIRMLN